MGVFRDDVAKDIYDVFLNLDHFADYHRVAGKRIKCVVDDDALRKRQSGQELSVEESSLMLFAKVDDLPTRQSPGQTINIDSREYIIDDWQEDIGMATLTLHQMTGV